MQYDGDNYFVPVDAQINRDADVPIDALRISDFAHALAQTPGKARILCSMPPAPTLMPRKGRRLRRDLRWSIRSQAN